MEMHSLTKTAFVNELQKIASMHGEEISPEMAMALLKQAGLISAAKNVGAKLIGKGGTVAEKAVTKAGPSAAARANAIAHKFAPRGGGGATKLVKGGLGQQGLQRASSGANIGRAGLGV